jgi:hypothetical protein
MLLVGLCLIASACTGGDGTGSTRAVTDITAVSAPDSAKTASTQSSSPGSETTPVSIPAGGNGPELSGKAFLSDDYHAYSSSAALRSNISSLHAGTGDPHTSLYNDGPSAGLAELDATVTYNGHPTVKYNQPGGTAAGPQMWPSFPKGKLLTDMWFRAVIRFSPGFTTYGVTPNCAKAYKLLGWGWEGMTGRGGLGFTNTTDYTFTWGLESAGKSLGFTEPTGFRKVTTEWTDGAWYDYVIHYEQTSATTTRTTLYIGRNSETPRLVYVMNGAANPGVTVPPVDRVMLGLNFNSVREQSQNQALWYGEWEVVDGSQYANPFDLN